MDRRQRNLVVGLLTATVVLLILSFPLGRINQNKNKPVTTSDTSIVVDDVYSKLDIKVDENGLVTWNAIPEAKSYVIDVQWYDEASEGYYGINIKVTDTSYQLEPGQSLMLKVVYKDGTESDYTSSVEYVK